MKTGNIVKTLALAGTLLGTATLAPALAEDTIKIGVLHSLSGTMARARSRTPC